MNGDADFDSVLYAIFSSRLELACNDDYFDRDSAIELSLSSNEVIYIFVDSFFGLSTGSCQLLALPDPLPLDDD